MIELTFYDFLIPNSRYYNCPNLWNTSNSQYADAHDDVAMETVDPQFIDAASGNLTIGNQTVKDLAVGDPRWY